ncbi:MAG: hypothetical protein ACLQU2_07140, partial [Candidatus Binataceae bacterium]
MIYEPSVSILVIDDEPERFEEGLRLGLSGKAEVEIVHPQNLSSEKLRDAHVVLVDYRLDHWPERDRLESISLRPSNGFALSAILREQVEASGQLEQHVGAFAIHSGHLSELRGNLPAASSEHLIAQLHNLEWVFPKGAERLFDQLVILAGAAQKLPYDWQAEAPEALTDLVRQFLKLDESDEWVGRALEDVRRCQPPIHELGKSGHGMLFLRWLLHRVLPYPCFLWDIHWLAARLRVSVSWLARVLAGSSALAADLKRIEYHGLLGGFIGTRWWSAGAENYVWNLTEGRSLEIKSLHDQLERLSGVAPEYTGKNPSFVCLVLHFHNYDDVLRGDQAAGRSG